MKVSKTILITGGAGFIGSNLIKELLGRGYQVCVIDNLSTGNIKNIEPFLNKIEFIEGDLIDLETVKNAVKGVDYILHQAAIPSVAHSIKNPLDSHNSNLNATLNVLLAAKENNVKKVIYASSSSIYGGSPELPKEENFPPNPLSFYALTKYAGEKYCQLFSKLCGLPTISLRYFNIFGPNQDPDSEYSAVIPKFIKLMLQGKQPVIYGDGEQTRDFTYIDNTVEANILAMESDISGEVINIACGEMISLNQLVEIINKYLGKNIKPIYQDERAGDVKHSLADISKAKKLLGYKPIVMIEEGLKKLIDHYERIKK
ncbi:MAG: SDR family oxidoreductase [Candidatus Terrybacteria bacterium]|nr:SDR family oxidoreductase [Candidatus Terrybacteria bacterium]